VGNRPTVMVNHRERPIPTPAQLVPGCVYEHARCLSPHGELPNFLAMGGAGG
jgi:hypothetical protein